MASQRNELARFGLSQKLLEDSSNAKLIAQSVGSVPASLEMILVCLLSLVAFLVSRLHGQY